MVVGLVTKYAGGVVKGFALIAGTDGDITYIPFNVAYLGILITGLAQWIVEGKPLGGKDL